MEDLEVVLHVLVDLHDGGDVSASVAIVGGGPDGDKVGVVEPELESIHNQLMGTGD